MGLSDLIAGGMDATAATELLLNVIWTIVGATLVYFMQAGFAMCEAGFTRAKNTGNILMKNMMDFVLGSLFFFIFGFAIMHGTDWNGIIGIKGFFNPTTLDDADGLFNGLPIGVFLIFHTVFCATSATIVSGSMAERTKFLAYLLYSAAISIFIYPVTGHWIWGGGWLAQMGFHDFAGSNCIHMVGGICALIGAYILGPRIGKFTKNKAGKITNTHKRLDRYKSIFGLAIGSPDLYDWIRENPGVVTYPISYCNDPANVGKQDNFVSINNCISVDLYGQICAESSGIRQISGTGGQLDFLEGAALSNGGKAFICLTSSFTDKQGNVKSRINPLLSPGDIVTDPRSLAYYIVTEYGGVNLVGCSTWERAEKLVSIAHPMFRDELIANAEKQGIWIRSNKR